MHGRRVFGLVMVAILGLVCASAGSGVAAQGRGTQPAGGRTQAALDRMTPAQRFHARVHATGRSSVRRVKLMDEGLSVDVFTDYGGVFTVTTARQYIDTLACRSGAVFSGFVVSSEVFPIDDGSMLFTDLAVQLTQVFRSPEKHELFNGETVTVTRPGGMVTIDGGQVGTDIKSFPALEAGMDYLFFVGYLPQFKTFHLKAGDGVFKLSAGRAIGFVPLPVASTPEPGLDFQSVIESIRGASCK